jgi:hypothetical protein
MADDSWGIDTSPLSTLEEAQEAAGQIVHAFNAAHQSADLHPRAEVDLTLGSVDQPLFVFTIHLDLASDVDLADAPVAAIDALTADLEGRIVQGPVDDHSWYVTVLGTEDQAG